MTSSSGLRAMRRVYATQKTAACARSGRAMAAPCRGEPRAVAGSREDDVRRHAHVVDAGAAASPHQVLQVARGTAQAVQEDAAAGHVERVCDVCRRGQRIRGDAGGLAGQHGSGGDTRSTRWQDASASRARTRQLLRDRSPGPVREHVCRHVAVRGRSAGQPVPYRRAAPAHTHAPGGFASAGAAATSSATGNAASSRHAVGARASWSGARARSRACARRAHPWRVSSAQTTRETRC